MNIHFIGTFTKSGEASFPLPATEYPLTRIANLLIDSTCLHETGEGTDLVLWGRILNLPEIYDRFGMKPGGNATLLDLFLAYPVEELLPLIDGNVTGILTTASSTLIFRDKNGGGLPVYYSGSYFSDHVEGIRMIAGALPEPNLKSLSMFLEYGYIPSPDTAFTGISKIPAGHLLVCKNGQFSIRNAFPFTDFTSQDNHLGLTLQEAADHYIHLHREAIRKRILGSDTVGALVSGGYDSGGNLA
ncbi:MAG: hypothetical protein HQ542_09940, partial [Bacteroidia bacterium]|nr:hypothetical protein [Bacteroidia bacterium]